MEEGRVGGKNLPKCRYFGYLDENFNFGTSVGLPTPSSPIRVTFGAYI